MSGTIKVVNRGQEKARVHMGLAFSLHILLEKKAILLKRIASKKGSSARDYAPKVLLCSNYASVKIDIPGFKILKHDK